MKARTLLVRWMYVVVVAHLVVGVLLPPLLWLCKLDWAIKSNRAVLC